VGLVVGGGTTVLALEQDALAHQPVLFLPAAALVCTYTFAAMAPPVWRVAGVLLLVGGVIVSLVLPHESLETFRAVITEFLAAYALGVGTRARRAQRVAEQERSRRLEEGLVAAVERERTRIARDMHDIVTHSVGLMVVQAEAGPLVVRTDPAKAEATFEAISETGREAVGQLRLMLGALRGTVGRGPQPGIETVPGLIEQTCRAGLAVTLTEHGTPRPVPPDVGIAAYRIIQESLTNTLRHAAARSVNVRLSWTGGTLTIEVADDGHGVADLTMGHGLVGIRERAEACGGAVAIDPRGFTVTATLPIG
jgi:signal transduction histidine kinase